MTEDIFMVFYTDDNERLSDTVIGKDKAISRGFKLASIPEITFVTIHRTRISENGVIGSDDVIMTFDTNDILSIVLSEQENVPCIDISDPHSELKSIANFIRNRDMNDII